MSNTIPFIPFKQIRVFKRTLGLFWGSLWSEKQIALLQKLFMALSEMTIIIAL